MTSAAVALSSGHAVGDAIARAKKVSVTSYVLKPESELVRDLVAAAARGARVDVGLAGDRFADGSVGKANAASQAIIEAAGGRVFYDRPRGNAPALHMKSIVADDRAFLDDRNWTFGDDETILEDKNPADVALIRRSQFFVPHTSDALTTDKGEALAREAELIRRTRGRSIDVETESFSGGKVEQALLERAQRGDRVRLLVLAGDVKMTAGAVLDRLLRAGVEVRETGGGDAGAGAEKMALGDDRAWVGSANATGWPANTVDWGVLTRDPTIVARLRAHFERDWNEAAARPAPAH